MTLISSISGIRGIFGAGLDASVLVDHTIAYGQWALGRTFDYNRLPCIVVGRDARVSGEICAELVISTLRSLGLDVIDVGLATTPTVAMEVLDSAARGGIVLSASHNPEEWNALKLLNEKGEFLSPEEGAEVMRAVGTAPAPHGQRIGSYQNEELAALFRHVDDIEELDFIDIGPIGERDFKIVVDGINSVGARAVPEVLYRLALDYTKIKVVNDEMNGRFAHPPEPLAANLTETMDVVRRGGFDLGIVVDPDVDRLALINERGEYVSEELTQVIAADFLWRRRSGPFVTNLSSSRAIDDLAARYGQTVHRSAVGEINVVKKMQEVGAILGGEGNGGVILPEMHYGRDALVGVAMVLQHLANLNITLSALQASMPQYVMCKHKVRLDDPASALARIADQVTTGEMSTIDGVKISFPHGWVHMRKSNTEPVVRIYSEAATRSEAEALAQEYSEQLLDGARG